MPRIPVVSRTMKVTVCNTLIVDVEAGDTFKEDIVIPREYATAEKRLKAVKEAYETDQLKPVNILSYEVITRKYYMLESEFVQAAKYKDTPVLEQKETPAETPKQTPAKKEKEVHLVKPSLKGKRRNKKRR